MSSQDALLAAYGFVGLNAEASVLGRSSSCESPYTSSKCSILPSPRIRHFNTCTDMNKSFNACVIPIYDAFEQSCSGNDVVFDGINAVSVGLVHMSYSGKVNHHINLFLNLNTILGYSICYLVLPKALI